MHGARHLRSPRTQAGTPPRRACTVARLPGPPVRPASCRARPPGPGRGRQHSVASLAAWPAGPALALMLLRAPRPDRDSDSGLPAGPLAVPRPAPAASGPKAPGGAPGGPRGRGRTGAGEPQAASPAGPPGAPARPAPGLSLHGCQPQAGWVPPRWPWAGGFPSQLEGQSCYRV